MSAEEDTELRDLVAQTLETNGVLGKIRAQLRASVFLALEEQESVQNKSPFLNKELKQFINTREGRVVTNLVREFLEFFKLDYSLAVFEPETNSGEYYEGRNALARDLDIVESNESHQQPLLTEVVKRCCSDMGGHRNAHTENQQSSASNLVESMNKKNAQDSLNSGGHTDNNQQRVSLDSPRDLLTGSDNDDDSFFDNATPLNDIMKMPSKETHNNKNGATYEYEESPRPKTPDTDRSVKDIDKKMSDLGLELPDDQDYDEDFESSKVSSINKTPRSGRSALKSARSDSTIQSIEEDIDDDFDDDELSGAIDLLKSDNSVKDDLTTDRTVSPHEHTEAFDYVEEIAP